MRGTKISTTRREVISDAGQEDRAHARVEGQGQGGSAADAARDRRGQEDRVARLLPTWWRRDPDLLAEELRSLRAAGFRVRQRETVAGSSLALNVERAGVRYRLLYPAGFPTFLPFAFEGWAPIDPLRARVEAQNARPGGAGVLAVEELAHGRRESVNFTCSTFGVLLAGPWRQIHDGEGGLLRAARSTRGQAVLVRGLTGTRRADDITVAVLGLWGAFDGERLTGWWARGDALHWDDGLPGIARQVERAITRHHKITRKAIWAEPRPLLGYASPSRYPGVTDWLFISRGQYGGRALGVVEHVTPESFRVRAPYAEQLADKRVAIIGCGSLGWPVAVGLARAGVRWFALYDADRLYPGNLARLGAGLGQTAQFKVDALRAELAQVASGMFVATSRTFVGDLVDARALVGQRPDLVIDSAADESTPLQTNTAALTLGVPAIYAWMTRGVRSARIFRIVPGRTPCYACVANARPASLVEERRSEAHEFTLIGANFNIDPIAAATVRMAVRTLAGDSVDASNPDHFVMRVGGPAPSTEMLVFRRDPKCRWCRWE